MQIRNKLEAALVGSVDSLFTDIGDILSSFSQDLEDIMDLRMDQDRADEAIALVRKVLNEWLSPERR